MSEDSHGRPHIANLFTGSDVISLPDQINLPTQARLNRFLRDDLKLDIEAPALGVRRIVEEMKTFRASGCLCWDVFRESGHGGRLENDHTLAATTTMQMEVQRVTAHCAERVFSTIEQSLETYQKTKKLGTLKKRSAVSVEVVKLLCGRHFVLFVY